MSNGSKPAQSNFIVQRTEGNDWHDKAKRFLSDNKCNPLHLEISADADPASIFQQALASIALATDQEFKIDAQAGVFLVTADLSAPPSALECKCLCGTSTACGGGGGGGKII